MSFAGENDPRRNGSRRAIPVFGGALLERTGYANIPEGVREEAVRESVPQPSEAQPTRRRSASVTLGVAAVPCRSRTTGVGRTFGTALQDDRGGTPQGAAGEW